MVSESLAVRRAHAAAALAHVRAQLKQLRAEVERQKAKRQDRVLYFLGSVVFAVGMFIVGAAPWAVEYFFLAFVAAGLPFRAIYYLRRKWQYFLLDFCYFVNLLVAAFLVVLPTDRRLEAVAFVLAEGPVGMAIMAWRCQWVFGSIDHQISFLLHFLPGLAMFTHRYYGDYGLAEGGCVHALYPQGPCKPVVPKTPRHADPNAQWSPSLWLFVAPLLFYCTWQLLYFLVVQVLLRETIKKDKELDTSYRHLSKRAKKANNFLHRLVNRGSTRRRLFLYGMIQLAYTVLTMGLAVFMFGSYHATVVWQIVKLTWGMWQGSKYQVDVLPKKMLKDVAEFELLKKNEEDGCGKREAEQGKEGAPTPTCGYEANTNLTQRIQRAQVAAY
mmetsp:Transcript_8258/g.51405  ORF Transcript_8258/g.51405 Transcript_8258/m.51405 type:complete len:385 (+) Transcript_8258:281-1435(+)